MKLLEVLKSAGAAILNVFAPGAGTAAAELVNVFLPEDQKLDPDKATGNEVLERIMTLPPETVASLLDSEIEMARIASDERKHKSDNFTTNQLSIRELEKMGRSRSRDIIAVLMALTVMMVCGGYMYALYMVEKRIPSGMELIGLLGIPSLLLKAHFGVETDNSALVAGLAQGKDVENLIRPGIGKAIASRMAK